MRRADDLAEDQLCQCDSRSTIARAFLKHLIAAGSIAGIRDFVDRDPLRLAKSRRPEI
jgi:hypothetical protein